MSSTTELDALLTGLGPNQQRLLRLAGDRPGPDGLRDLAEHLRTTNQELRAQREELAQARRRLAMSDAENESYFRSSPHPRAITDTNGCVLRTNPAADRLIRRRPEHGGRPITTWFQISDRGRVRSMITRMQRCVRAGQEGSAADQGLLRLPGDDLLPVVLAVTTAADTRTGTPVLRWELRTDLDTTPDPQLHGASGDHDQGLARPDAESDALAAIPAQSQPALPHSGQTHSGLPHIGQTHSGLPHTGRARQPAIALAESLASMSGQLATYTDFDATLRGVLESTIAIVPGAQRAAITLRRRDETVAAAGSDDAALACEQAQASTNQGPVPQALAGHCTVVVSVREMRAPWPQLAVVAARADIRRILAVPLSYGDQTLGVLTLYSGHADAFSTVVRELAPLVAVHAAVALARLEREQHLQVALASRQHIGEAVGILVERHRILPGQAFERLVKASQQRNIKVRELAELVIQTGQDPEDVLAP